MNGIFRRFDGRPHQRRAGSRNSSLQEETRATCDQIELVRCPEGEGL
jgi:hypothetical protein